MSHQSELIEKDIEAYLAEHERKELLRFLTCGSVDDGKSTLIGRLLHDTRMIYEDQLQAIHRDSQKGGSAGGELDLSLLVDGLKAEREQGITIDVAYRYFSTAKRKFIIADTPGHEQYTRNMVTGASTCDLAIILIDARNGIATQTLRHSFIAALLGIRHIAVAINKMDAVEYSREIFDRIRANYLAFSGKLGMKDIAFLPLSALKGDNVVERSRNTPWYDGPVLMEYLETVPVSDSTDLKNLRFPVQYVIRPNLDFRGFAGTIASGIVKPGDDIVALPSRKTSRIRAITTYDGPLSEAFAGQAPVITLETEIDVSRGDMLAHPTSIPHAGHDVDAMLVWMADEPMVPGRQYAAKHTTRITNAIINTLHYRVDVNTMERQQGSTLSLNEIGRCGVTFSDPIAWDPYAKNRTTGAFIIIDRLTNVTVGAGMILDPEIGDPYSGGARLDTGPDRARSGIVPVTSEERAARFGQQPVTVLLTGYAGSGKRSIAKALERRLFDMGRAVLAIDGDGNYSNLDQSLADSAKLAAGLGQAGFITLLVALAPTRAGRESARRIAGGNFIEIFVSAPLDICRNRDQQGLYVKAQVGDLKNFPGVTGTYEEPSAPDLTIPTYELSVDQCVTRILDLLRERRLLEAKPVTAGGFDI
ncbi:MAG: sulfate adenylyltransferase subunit CysN [Deltaproteobacteria bacterium]|nr:sulfate adenylyltransferase subunit CysN [Deltaproteobacteria bacterium]